ncbi:hypothetical protein [Frondihabitans peucedani]|uniref:Glycosyltransferase RgtA/B/C/D-like domain-containing protein n=1 Tax=Frondihabitans peucedani TaxID=598626 RepID=A0ABP8E0J2_9MICO
MTSASATLDSPGSPADTSAPDRRSPLRTAELALAAFGVVAAVLVAVDAPGVVRAVVDFVAMLLVPGWAVLRRFPAIEPAARLVFTAVGSIVVFTLLSLVMAWTGLWHPRAVAVVVLLAGAALILRRPLAPLATVHSHSRVVSAAPRRRRDRERGTAVWPFVALAVAAVLFGVGVALTNSGDLGQFGLLPALPVFWYLAVAICFVVAMLGLFTTRRSHGLLAASIGLLTVILYATPNLVESAPRLPWVYKHIAVTNYLFSSGHVDTSIDLYNRWPGLFSFSASLGAAIGLHDAVSYASLAEVFFALVDGVLVLAIARTISRHRRWAWTAVLVFTFGNWVGQNYYSPQAFAFMLYLTAALVAMMALGGEPRRIMSRIEGQLARPARRLGRAINTETLGISQSSRARVVAIVALLALQGVIAASHQLTPYMAILTLFPLFVLGYLRPFWVGLAVVALPLAYLVPNFGYIEKHFGLFSSFNPVANATTASVSAVGVSQAASLQSHGVMLLTGLAVLLALAGFVRHLLNGHVRMTLVVAWFAAAPILTVFGQSYGGEGKFRVFLFGLPFYAMGVAWLFWSGKGLPRLQKTGLIATLSVLLVLFVGTYYQPEASLRISKSDVTAATWLDEHFEKNDTAATLSDSFPLLIGPNYPKYTLRYTQVYSLDGLLTLRPDVTNADIEDFILHGYSTIPGGRTWVAFSENQEHTAILSGAFTKADVRQLEATVAAESKLAYDHDGTRIYRIDNR